MAASIPRDPNRFERFGLLWLGDVGFSRDRSLAATVQRLLGESPDGWTDKELRGLLRVAVHPFLLAAVRQGLARREQLGGVFVYLAADPQLGTRQRQARQERCAASAASWPPERLPCCWRCCATPAPRRRPWRGVCKATPRPSLRARCKLL